MTKKPRSAYAIRCRAIHYAGRLLRVRVPVRCAVEVHGENSAPAMAALGAWAAKIGAPATLAWFYHCELASALFIAKENFKETGDCEALRDHIAWVEALLDAGDRHGAPIFVEGAPPSGHVGAGAACRLVVDNTWPARADGPYTA